MKISNEAKVGLLILLTLILGGGFAWFIGIKAPFGNTVSYYVTYNFAGGIDVGSPVRVSGIKVGKVESIDFFAPSDPRLTSIQEPGSDPVSDDKVYVPLKVKISVRKDVMVGIRKDSRFYINLAGIIGERYVEITPGRANQPMLEPGATVAGVDPPRIDQLLSQSFDLAGKIADIIDENKGDISKSIDLLYKLSGNINKTLEWVDRSKVFKNDLGKLIENLIAITEDVRKLTEKTRTPEGEKTLKLLHELLWRLEPLDSKNIRQFLQKEGVRVHIF
jgi:phospholipid/cholesterol/gamma-HCH transport system substrate-binding protein